MQKNPLEDLKQLMEDDRFTYAVKQFVRQEMRDEVRDVINSLEDKQYELQRLVDSVTNMYQHFKDDEHRFETLSEFNTMLKKLEDGQR